MMSGAGAEYGILMIGGALLLLVLFALSLMRIALLTERRRARFLHGRLQGKATVSGYVFYIDGHRCRVWNNRIGVPFEIALHKPAGRFSVVGPRSVWGIDLSLKYREICSINKMMLSISTESQELYEELIAHPDFKLLLAALFDIHNPAAMVLHTIPVGRGKNVLRFSALPERIYAQPEKLENLIKKSLSIFERLPQPPEKT